MKRSALLFGALMLGAASAANAQGLTMQMSNGWNFAFSGNVNIFGQYQSSSTSGNTNTPGGLVGAGQTKGFFYGTGLLPAFATFTANGKEGNTDLGVHFGFAPEVQCGARNGSAGNVHDCFGTQIDMRQVFLTVGGKWGQILAGRELGVFLRQNILNDQTLFGVGGGGINPVGTTLGRIGFGYIYPNFVAQMTYTTPAGRPGSLSIGLMDPSGFGRYTRTELPRAEAEASYKTGNILVFGNGTVQRGKDIGATNPLSLTLGDKKTAWGVGGGATYKTSTFSVHGSGYYGRGLSTTLLFNGVGTGSAFDNGVAANGKLRRSYGYYGQLTVTPPKSKLTLAGSFGSSFLKSTNGDDPVNFKTENSLVSGGLYYQATKSLKLVGEGNYQWTKDKEKNFGNKKNKAGSGAFGMMLFF